MKEEKNVMQAQESAGEYLAPKVKVVEIKPRRVVCTSMTGGTEDSSEGSTAEWY